MSDTTYNGWANWETWNTCLWLDNDYDAYKTCLRAARDFWRSNYGQEWKAERDLEAWLKENAHYYVGDEVDFSKVDWSEIVDRYFEEVKEGEEA